ncbi:DUF3800 domain-containing protein [Streptomyces sp. NPDC057579]|uniref:DUF3800 domain-containing protein n=1 Tax=Streptomyces sp. NPDC057579 TaxID=3346172 RepID=UPI003673C942
MAVPRGSGAGHSCFRTWGSLLYLCYLDESGTGQTLNPAVPDSVPVMVIGGFTVPENQVQGLVWDFLELKKRFRPELRRLSSLTQMVHHEVKGEALRKNFRREGRNRQRMAHGFLDQLINILERRGCTVMARIWVKQDGARNDESAMYAAAVTTLCATFEHYLAERSSSGIAVLDSRNPHDNTGNVHCVTTRRFGKDEERLPHLPESPVFGHSNTHIGLQIADLLVSAVLAPAAAVTYVADLSGTNVHCHPGYRTVRERHCPRIGKLQHRYRSVTGKWVGGVVVSDARGQESAGKLFAPLATTQRDGGPLPRVPEQVSSQESAPAPPASSPAS